MMNDKDIRNVSRVNQPHVIGSRLSVGDIALVAGVSSLELGDETLDTRLESSTRVVCATLREYRTRDLEELPQHSH